MRVITGSAKGRKLQTLEGMDVRPTTERVKEAMFSMIQFEIPGATVLDLFAGSGQLGIEALSRGASLCVFVDNFKRSHEIQKENLQNTGLMEKSRAVLNDYKSYLAGTKDRFDIVILDPPYGKDIIPDILDSLHDRLNDGGKVICETGLKEQLPEGTDYLKIKKSRKFGKVKLTVYEKK